MYYSEDEIDKIVKETFFPNITDGVMVEVGAGPPTFISSSKHFRDLGWRCICIDPNPKFVEQHKAEGSEIYQYACSNKTGNGTFQIYDSTTYGHSSENSGVSHSALSFRYGAANSQKEINVEIIKLNDLLEKLNIKKVDYVSIDVEGWEIEVMQGFDVSKYKPKVIVLENFLYADEYTTYMESVGYTLHQNIKYNYIYTKI
jgi:FkbM family methyltransferase